MNNIFKIILAVVLTMIFVGGLVINANGATNTSFTFGSSAQGVVYECSVNGGSYVVCQSPVSYSLKAGNNTINFRAKVKIVENVPPTAAFIFSPQFPITGETVVLNSSSSICINGPCTYEWSDDGGTTRPSKVLWSLGTGTTLNFVFHEAGTKYVRLVVKNSLGEESTVEHNVDVKLSSPPTEAPKNTALPVISGKNIESETLNTTTGSWSNSPTSYIYQWQDCNVLTENCVNISGASSKSYTLTNLDVGNKISVGVIATNSGGSSTAYSGQTSVIVAHEKEEPPIEEEHKTPVCTTTTSSITKVNTELTSGAVVCLNSGNYGSVNISASPSSNATLKAAVGAKVTFSGVRIEGKNLTVSQVYSTNGITVGSNGGNDVIEHNDVTSGGYGISVLCSKGCSSSDTISNVQILYNKIHNTSNTGEGDALRFDGWSHISVIGNDVYSVNECAGNSCHTDTLQSYNANISTTGLIIEKNYVHDNAGAQGLPFLKDGDISNVVIANNLSIRNTSTGGQITGIWVDDNTVGLNIHNNTYLEGSVVQSGGSATNPTVEVNHNVFSEFNIPSGAYKVNEDYNIYTGSNEWSFTLGPHSVINHNPEFINTSVDDYRLKNNPNGIGVDWSPTEIKYGPTGE